MDGGPATASARATLATALHVQLRLLAPFLPYATEEVWSWWQAGSIHRAAWPAVRELGDVSGEPAVLHAVSVVLSRVRRAKSQGKVSMRTEAAAAAVRGATRAVELAQAGGRDLVSAGKLGELRWVVDDTVVAAEGESLALEVSVTL